MHIPKGLKQANKPSYFPEKERKKWIVRVKDNLVWLFRYKEVNKFYTLYGLDIKDAPDMELYKDYRSFMIERNRMNRPYVPESQVSVLRDKFMFYKYMLQENLPTPEIFTVMLNGILYDTGMHQVHPEEYLVSEQDYFIKDFTGECASFVKYIKDYKEYESTVFEKNCGYIFQRKITQCVEMARLNPCSINTIRIVTVNKDGNPYVLSSVLRVGTAKSCNVDNWAAGGLSVGVNNLGKLRKYGFFKHADLGKTDIHPDTKVVFSEFQIPQYRECAAAAIEAHRHFYGVRFIGWDVAVTDQGPVFIEGNDNWEISLMQASNVPMRKDWNNAMD